MPSLAIGYMQVLFVLGGLILLVTVSAILLVPVRGPFGLEHSGLSDTRLLIVEDNENVRRELRAVFSSRSIAVVGEATNISQAVAAVTTGRPDVVMVDLRAPQEGGIEACRAIKARIPRAHVILLTSASEEEAARIANHAGASALLLKPVSCLRVAEAVEQVARSTPVSSR